MKEEKNLSVYSGLALAMVLLAAVLFYPYRKAERPAAEVESPLRLPSADDLGPDHEPDSQQEGAGLETEREGEGRDSASLGAQAAEGEGVSGQGGEDGGVSPSVGYRSTGVSEGQGVGLSGSASAPDPMQAGSDDDPISVGSAGEAARRKRAGYKPGLIRSQAGGGERADPALRALKTSLQKALAASGSLELARLGKLLDGPDLAGAIPKVQKALVLVKRIEAVGQRVSRLDEEFNLKRIELQADRQARGGREGALRREISDMERQLRGNALEQAGLRKELESIAGKTPPPDPAQSRMPFNLPVSGAARTAVQTAYAQLGKPYVWGADGTRSYDCSGLVMHAWDKAGVDMLHSSRIQSRTFPTVGRNALAPGDLLYFYNPVHHVAMYVGEGKMIHAPATGDVVRVAPVNWKNFVWANRPQPKPQR